MNIFRYIEVAIAAGPRAITSEVVSSACVANGVSPSSFCDLYAEDVRRRYLKGEISWRDGDTAMNVLSGYFFTMLPKGMPFPDYAFSVFLAFDAGETIKAPDNELITREQLQSLVEPPNYSSEPTGKPAAH